jgi:hypothetical protein
MARPLYVGVLFIHGVTTHAGDGQSIGTRFHIAKLEAAVEDECSIDKEVALYIIELDYEIIRQAGII